MYASTEFVRSVYKISNLHQGSGFQYTRRSNMGRFRGHDNISTGREQVCQEMEVATFCPVSSIAPQMRMTGTLAKSSRSKFVGVP
jgi:hypothetical protein